MSGLTKQVPLWSFLLTVLIAFGGASVVWGQSKQELVALRSDLQSAKLQMEAERRESNARYETISARLVYISETVYEIKGRVSK
jgi:hypothetical protein